MYVKKSIIHTNLHSHSPRKTKGSRGGMYVMYAILCNFQPHPCRLRTTDLVTEPPLHPYGRPVTPL